MNDKKFEKGERYAGDWWNPMTAKYERVRGYFHGMVCGAAEIGTEQNTEGGWLCAPNSLARLKRKERRRIFIQRDEALHLFQGRGPVNAWANDRGCSDYVCFIECRERKGEK